MGRRRRLTMWYTVSRDPRAHAVLYSSLEGEE
jgi:hypothetical protein